MTAPNPNQPVDRNAPQPAHPAGHGSGHGTGPDAGHGSAHGGEEVPTDLHAPNGLIVLGMVVLFAVLLAGLFLVGIIPAGPPSPSCSGSTTRCRPARSRSSCPAT